MRHDVLRPTKGLAVVRLELDAVPRLYRDNSARGPMSAFPKADVQNVGIWVELYGCLWPKSDAR